MMDINAVSMFPCPCCQNLTISEPGDFEICEVCGWEDDPVQSSDPSFAGGANRLSLDKAREAWLLKNRSLPAD